MRSFSIRWLKRSVNCSGVTSAVIASLLAASIVALTSRAASVRGRSSSGFSFVLEGRTQGTTYQVKYRASQNRNYQPEIDSILHNFSQSLSTYIDDSEISVFNRSHALRFRLPYFYPVLVKAREVYQLTNGAFDPTVMPLVEAYGFSKNRMPAESVNIDSLRQYVGFHYIGFDSVSVWKQKAHVRLDLNAIAQGYSVDVVSEFLERHDIRHYMVEIGGEVRCRGKNTKAKTWMIGIRNPGQEPGRGEALLVKMPLTNQAMATSARYGNYFIKDGKRYSHLINPKTGQMEQNSLLSVTIFAKECMTADAYATACMVMGLEKAQQLLPRQKGLMGYFVFTDAQGEVKTWSFPERMQRKLSVVAPHSSFQLESLDR